MPPHRKQQSRSLWGRALLILFALGATGLIMSVGIANVTARRMPQVAVNFWPFHAAANARLAEFMITTDPQRQIKSAAPLAAKALRRDPTLAPAARILALNALVDKDSASAVKLFDYSAAVSRRDLATQLWYIEKEVAEEDVEGALKHFDIALRTSPGSQRILFPILTSALQDPRLRPAIARLLTSKPAWAPLFLQQAALSSPEPVSVANLYLTMHSLGKPPTPDVVRDLVNRLASSGRFDAAIRLHKLLDPKWERSSLGAQLDGGFSREANTSALSWVLNPTSAWLAPRPGGKAGAALHLASEGDEQWAARRLLVLPAGQYQLSGLAGDAAGGAYTLSARLVCVSEAAQETSASARLVSGAIRMKGTLTVSGANCPAQWLTLGVKGEGSDTAASPWIDDLTLTRK